MDGDKSDASLGIQVEMKVMDVGFWILMRVPKFGV
jgi:hypothetical protein